LKFSHFVSNNKSHEIQVFSWITAAEKIPKGPEQPYIEDAKKQWIWLENELKNSKLISNTYILTILNLEPTICLL
jgi:hypothetical protein